MTDNVAGRTTIDELRRRRRNAPPKVRVELQIPEEIAARLFAAANDCGQTLSRLGSDALDAYLPGGDANEVS